MMKGRNDKQVKAKLRYGTHCAVQLKWKVCSPLLRRNFLGRKEAF
jgi:hypothetical protein